MLDFGRPSLGSAKIRDIHAVPKTDQHDVQEHIERDVFDVEVVPRLITGNLDCSNRFGPISANSSSFFNHHHLNHHHSSLPASAYCSPCGVNFCQSINVPNPNHNFIGPPVVFGQEVDNLSRPAFPYVTIDTTVGCYECDQQRYDFQNGKLETEHHRESYPCACMYPNHHSYIDNSSFKPETPRQILLNNLSHRLCTVLEGQSNEAILQNVIHTFVTKETEPKPRKKKKKKKKKKKNQNSNQNCNRCECNSYQNSLSRSSSTVSSVRSSQLSTYSTDNSFMSNKTNCDQTRCCDSSSTMCHNHRHHHHHHHRHHCKTLNNKMDDKTVVRKGHLGKDISMDDTENVHFHTTCKSRSGVFLLPNGPNNGPNEDRPNNVFSNNDDKNFCEAHPGRYSGSADNLDKELEKVFGTEGPHLVDPFTNYKQKRLIQRHDFMDPHFIGHNNKRSFVPVKHKYSTDCLECNSDKGFCISEGCLESNPKPDWYVVGGFNKNLDFTLDYTRAEHVGRTIARAKRKRQWCRALTAIFGLVFFVLIVVIVSLSVTRGRKVFGSM